MNAPVATRERSLTEAEVLEELVSGKVLVVGVDRELAARRLTEPGRPLEGLRVHVSLSHDPVAWELY